MLRGSLSAEQFKDWFVLKAFAVERLTPSPTPQAKRRGDDDRAVHAHRHAGPLHDRAALIVHACPA
jgi:hypothetical protein